jgi:hypothetical protein
MKLRTVVFQIALFILLGPGEGNKTQKLEQQRSGNIVCGAWLESNQKSVNVHPYIAHFTHIG